MNKIVKVLLFIILGMTAWNLSLAEPFSASIQVYKSPG